MKKLIPIILLILISLLSYGQIKSVSNIIDEVIMETNGTIIERNTSSYGVILMDYYNLDLLKMDIETVFDKYNYIKVLKPWELWNKYYIIMIGIQNDVITISYGTKNGYKIMLINVTDLKAEDFLQL